MEVNESCKKTNSLAFAGSSLALSFEMAKPAAEKTLFDSADVASIANS